MIGLDLGLLEPGLVEADELAEVEIDLNLVGLQGFKGYKIGTSRGK